MLPYYVCIILYYLLFSTLYAQGAASDRSIHGYFENGMSTHGALIFQALSTAPLVMFTF